ncbi:MAG: glycosyltransferase family 4 protein [Phycisphaerales bacterium]
MPLHDKTILIISQVYVPDSPAVGQHFHDAAAALAKRGHRVKVITSARGYDDPTLKFPARETRDGVEIRRMPLSSFGNASIPLRILAQLLFLVQAIAHGLFTRKLACLFVSTSPPMCAVGALVIRAIRRVPLKYWVMDVNPDQVIELGKMKPGSLPVKLMLRFQQAVLKRADDVIVLDRFMGDRINKMRDVSEKLHVIPPWAHDDVLEPIPHETNPFRKDYALDGKFVVMYSGNHGFSTPVTTILDAAVRLKDRDDIVFAFIGGGVGKEDVRRTIATHNPGNILDLPYQPLEKIKYSLSAADLHVVTVGPQVVGVVHPCKVYGAMAVARPILLVAPDPCHASDILKNHEIGWHVNHADVDATVAAIEQAASASPERRARMGELAREALAAEFASARSIALVCDVIERGVVEASAPAPAADAQNEPARETAA